LAESCCVKELRYGWYQWYDKCDLIRGKRDIKVMKARFRIKRMHDLRGDRRLYFLRSCPVMCHAIKMDGAYGQYVAGEWMGRMLACMFSLSFDTCAFYGGIASCHLSSRTFRRFPALCIFNISQSLVRIKGLTIPMDGLNK
jgi:hypothetical protein